MPDTVSRHSYGTATAWWGHEQNRIVEPVSAPSLTLLRRSVPSAADRIAHLARLKDGWNGDGSVRMSQISLDLCADLLCRLASCSHHLARTVFISPLSSGGVELEWDSLHSRDFLLSIPESGFPVEYLISDPVSGDTIEEGTIHTQEAIRLFKAETCSQSSTMDFQPHHRLPIDFTAPSILNTTREMARYRQQHFPMARTE